MGPLGWQETVFIFVLALLIFGPKKLPELGKTLGKAITEFRRASTELKNTWEREAANLEQDKTIAELKQIGSEYSSEIQDGSSPYSYEEGSPDSIQDDPYAEISSTVSASATEGAEPTADVAPDYGVAEAETTGQGAETAAETEVAGALDPDPVPKPVEQTGGGHASESHALAG
jgi:TatA/E family protein of Tat protein translocase